MLLGCTFLSGCLDNKEASTETVTLETTQEATEEVIPIQEFTDEDLSYAFYYDGEKKDYMHYDNISYIIYSEYSSYANSNKGIVYDLKNKKCYYTYLYGTQLASMYTKDDDSIEVSDLTDKEIEDLRKSFSDNNLLEFPAELYTDSDSEYGLEWRLGLIYEPGEFMSYSGSGDYSSEKYNVKAVRESILGKYQ